MAEQVLFSVGGATENKQNSILAKLIEILNELLLQQKNALTDVELRASPVEVHPDLAAVTDIFSRLRVSNEGNQIEVPFNDTNWATFVSVTASGGGAAAQSQGAVTFSASTGTNGRYLVKSLDNVRYRAGSSIAWGFTFLFPLPGIANAYQRIGPTGATEWFDGVWFGYEGVTFGLSYWRNGAQIWFKPVADWTNMASYGGTFDPAKDQLAYIEAGLFGNRGFRVLLMSMTGQWIEIAAYTGINADAVPAFTDFDLYIAAEVRKTGAAATDISLRTACWGGWTGMQLKRLSDTFSDRTLVLPTQSVIVGKTTGGGGGYVAVKVSPSGAATVDATGSVVSAQDIFSGGEVLADQAGAGAALTFTFSAAVQLVMVFAKSATGTLQARADPFGGTPSAAAGAPCEDGVPMAFPVNASAVKVFAPTGMTVSVWGFRY